MIKVDKESIKLFYTDIENFLKSRRASDSRAQVMNRKLDQYTLLVNHIWRQNLTRWLQVMRSDIEQSDETKTLSLHKESILLLDVYNDLVVTKKVPNWERLTNVVFHDERTGSFVDELACLKDLVETGHLVEICDETGITGRKTADFILHNDGQSIHVEVKSLEDRRSSEVYKWLQATKSLNDTCQSKSISYHITIDVSDITNPNLKQRIIECMSSGIKAAKEYGEEALPSGKVVFRRFHDPIKLLPPQIGDPPDGFERYVSARVDKAHPENVDYAIAFDIRVQLMDDLIQTTLNQIGSAAKKFPSESANIIYIGMPFVDGRYFMEQTDILFDSIYNELNRKRSRINAVVLMAKTINSGILASNQQPITYERFIISCHQPKVPFPRWFSFPLANMDNEIDLNSEGTLSFQFQPHAPMIHQRGKNLFWLLSPTGNTQVRIWQNYTDRLRFDVMSKLTKRILIDADVSSINPYDRCFAALTWKVSEVILHIFTPDGELKFYPRN